MKITSLKELIDRGQTQGATMPGVDYLIQSPGAFIELVKQDIVLALNYTKFFSLEDIEKITQGSTKFFTSLYLLTQNPGVFSVFFIKTPLDINDKNILPLMNEIKKQFQFQARHDEWSLRDVYYYVTFQGDIAFETGKDYDFSSMRNVDYAVCELAYKSSTHVQDVEYRIKEIVTIMLEKLKESSLKENILDKEFTEDFFSNFFAKKYYLIDSIVENKNYEWLDKLSTCMSKATLIQQLDKSQQRLGALSAEVAKKFDELIASKGKELASNNAPSAPPAYEITPKQYLDALTRIAELEQEVVGLKVQLKAAQLKSENQSATLNAYARSTNTAAGSSTLHQKFSYQ
jgi:hypothetical protein